MGIISKRLELEKEIAELKAENDRLKEEIKEVKKYQYQQEYLDKEIAELKAYKDVNEDFKTAWEELKAENDRLKEEIKNFEDKLQLRMTSDKESDAFWDEIFSEEDYPFNKENVYKELKDYYFVLEQLPKIYMKITGGTLSKTTYFASSVIEAYNDSLERYYDEIDDLEYQNNNYKQALQEIKAIVKKNITYQDTDSTTRAMTKILGLITKAEEE